MPGMSHNTLVSDIWFTLSSFLDPKSTLMLLFSHDSLARHVTSFSIHAPNKHCIFRKDFVETQDQLIEVISKMTSLKTIWMYASMFSSVAKEKSFLERLRECNIPISNFAFIASNRPTGKELSRNGFILFNLTTLTWHTPVNNRKQSMSIKLVSCCKSYIFTAVRLMGPVWNILKASRESLRHISLLINVFDYQQLWSIHFPSLHTLQLNIWQMGSLNDLRDMLTFILLHKSTLGILDTTPHQIPDEHEFNPDLFPFIRDRNQDLAQYHGTPLRSFRGNFQVLFHLLNVDLTIFSRLENLDLTFRGDPLYSFDVTASHVYLQTIREHAFPSLRRLHLLLHFYQNLDLQRRAISSFIEGCQLTLEVLKLGVRFSIDPREFAGWIVNANRLGSIHFLWEIAAEYENEEYVRILSSSCKSLREVWMENGDKVLRTRIKRDSADVVVGLEVEES
jgi:hypothetical protein